MKKKKSFTLAEVLITLVIIGIIAAITVPVIMANHRKSETTAKLKKFNSTIQNAIKLAETEWGVPLEEWDVSDMDDGYDYGGDGRYFIKYLAKYIKYNKEYRDYFSDDFPKGCIGLYCVVLDDGMLLSFDNNDITFFIDINGEKGPNAHGRDQFEYMLPNSSFYNYKKKNNTREDFINDCAEDPALGLTCSYILQLYDAWEIKDDYPIRL